MKTTNLLLVLLASLTFGSLGTLTAYAQVDMINGATQAVRYQAIAKDQQGNPVSNQTIGFRVSIISDTITGTVQWEETHTPTTDGDGLFAVLIGTGTRTGGAKTNFADIEWANTKHFLKVEMDITGGNNFTDMGTTQFCSVPFAFSASEAVRAETAKVAEKADTAKVAMAVAACGCTLDNAYDHPTAGAGRFIFADAGAVEIFLPTGTNGYGLFVRNLSASSTSGGIYSRNSNIGINNNIFAHQFGFGFGIVSFIQNTINGDPAIGGLTFGEGVVIAAETRNISNINPTIFSNTNGNNSAGYFISRQSLTNTQSVLRVEAENPLTRVGTFQALDSSHSTDALLVSTVGTGPARAGIFQILNAANAANALQVETVGSGNAVRAISLPTGTGGAGSFEIQNPANTSNTLEVNNLGTGFTGFFTNNNATDPTFPVLGAINTGTGGVNSVAGGFLNDNPNNSASVTLAAQNNGLGRAGSYWINNTANTDEALFVNHDGVGTVLWVHTDQDQDPNKYVALFSNHGPTNADNNFTTLTETVSNNGHGAVSIHSGTNGIAGAFVNFDPSNQASSLLGINFGTGIAVSGLSVGGTGLRAYSLSNAGDPALIVSKGIFSFGDAALFYGNVQINGSYTATGSKSSVVKNSQGDKILTYSEESAEVWFTDYGVAQLVNGEATINIEPEFLSTINTNEIYHVFVDLRGPCFGGICVADQTPTSFRVIQNTPGPGQGQGPGVLCNTQFSYRITAKRKGFETLRLATEQQNKAVTDQYLQDNFPEIFVEAQQKANAAINEKDNISPINYTIRTPQAPPSLSNILLAPTNQSIDVVAPVDTVSVPFFDISDLPVPQ